MKIKLSVSFREKLANQVKFISKDKPGAARMFKNDLLLHLRKIPEQPYSYRRSHFFKDENIRDLIFKGYVITFRILPHEDTIRFLVSINIRILIKLKYPIAIHVKRMAFDFQKIV